MHSLTKMSQDIISTKWARILSPQTNQEHEI